MWSLLALNSTHCQITHVVKRWKSTIRRIDKLLIANRGEIACRVLRTARRLGVKTVAVYSEADQHALHVSQADEAYNIGPPPASQSYLRGDKLLEVAHKAGCQAIHPGYGFLSENVEFAENCEKNNIIFIGPPASAIQDMGIKSKSKEIMSKAGVPIIEGYHGEDQSKAKLKQEAQKIGYPIMIKAVRGGGGKGMRIANTESEFEEALESAKSEAQKAFGDSVVLLEKFVAEPRHVEVQVFADLHGNAVHLFERDCSVQRRHQKIIEEAPAPGLSEELRSELGAAAVRAAKAVGYVGAGTVEFILDKKSHSFHFMEMNTRLQVEHPITEMITGTDLVEWQIKAARGEKLPLNQDQISLRGHSFEARIYAEDPSGGFLPGAGVLSYLRSPPVRDDIRIETGVREGDEVSVHYDPMIAKLVVWGENRAEALLKMQTLLTEYNVTGLQTNVNFLLDLARHPEFISGNVHTNFIKENNDSLFKTKTASETQLIQAALGVILQDEVTDIRNAVNRKDQFNPFIVESGFRINHQFNRDIKLEFKNEEKLVRVKFVDQNVFHVSLNGGKSWKIVNGQLSREDETVTLRCTIDGIKNRVNIFSDDNVIAIFDNSGKVELELEKASFLTEEVDDSVSGGNKAFAPMPGVLDKILVNVGDSVKKGDSLFVLIAMKMEYVVKATRDATVENIFFKAGDNVQKDVTILQFKEENMS
ncbi:hypothetical protein Zmor_006883 [Zophobas morio]|uniref:Methylcrotonoyl-CoA carboxylase subunit alpha, mitochondrial n=1 Tax=Zophobas morio TaxID=2755281 RepID=A0AA38IVU7_9CUCU|nr:hypothetical protein Zmor_006883 [Zophobas morio]